MSEAPVRYGTRPQVLPADCDGCGARVQKPVTDHCHVHGWIRGRVCRRCNARMSFIDRRIAPKVESVLLKALLALWRRCPDCGPLEAADLAPGMPRGVEIPVKQISLRLPDELHDQVKAAAERNRRSLHAEILWRLEQAPQEPDGDGK